MYILILTFIIMGVIVTIVGITKDIYDNLQVEKWHKYNKTRMRGQEPPYGKIKRLSPSEVMKLVSESKMFYVDLLCRDNENSKWIPTMVVGASNGFYISNKITLEKFYSIRGKWNYCAIEIDEDEKEI